MAKSIAILDTWLLMVACDVMVLIASGNALSKSWGVAVVCLLEAAMAVGVIASCSCRQSGSGRTVQLLMRVLFAVVLAWLLWFQSHPWCGSRDWEATDHDVMLQRIHHLPYFLLFTAAFFILGFAHTKFPTSPAVLLSPKRYGLVAIVILGLALSLTLRFFGMLRPVGRDAAAIGIFGVAAIVLFECARRVERAERGAFVGFAIVTCAIPLILLL